MSPDDPRHGTYAGTVAHYIGRTTPCRPCLDAAATYRRHRRTRLYLAHTDTLMVPATGTIRRIQALVALGHTMKSIDAHLGRQPGYTSLRLRLYKTVIQRATAQRYAAIYDRLSMVRPEGRYADRTRALADMWGWAPPLAWDNIDDPNETPQGIGYTPPTRTQQLADLDHQGAGIAETCRRLKVTTRALEKWCYRNDHVAMYMQMLDRDNPHRNTNQHAKEAS